MEHFLHFTKGERSGVLILMTLCIGLFIAPKYLPDRSKSEATDFSALHKDIDRWYTVNPSIEEKNTVALTSSSVTTFYPNTATQDQLLAHGLSNNTIRSWLSYIRKGGRFDTLKDLEKFRALSPTDLKRLKPYLLFNSNHKDVVDKVTSDQIVEISYFSFDPNTVTKEELIQLGISEKTANNWTKFTANGGSFKQAQDIQKIYGLKESDYQRLSAYISIAESPHFAPVAYNNTPHSYENTNKVSSVIIDINKANAEEWQQLRGIGPAYSKRIVNFRNKLGGFHSVQQIAETYGLPDSVFQKIQLSLRPSPLLQQLKINQLSEKELATHPYLSFNDAKVIVQYRGNHGSFSHPADLEKLYALDAETIVKIEPYLSFE